MGEAAAGDPAAVGRPALHVLTCGSVDDGKSTLIGRLLHEQNLIPDDHAAALRRDSRRHGSAGEAVDFALLMDGLEAEREQGITIDVAYRYFRTSRRAFVVADTPGHEQYTRNMATGASNAQLAILLVDARKGLLKQTHRHAVIASLLGIRQVVLAVNKIDLVGYAQDVFARVEADFRRFAERLALDAIVAIPLSAREGDNLSARSARTPWYVGPTLLEHLETVEVADRRRSRPFRMPVQAVARSASHGRGFVGTVSSGSVRVGDSLLVANSGRGTTVARIVTADGDLERAEAGDAITLTLADEVDVARGDLLAAPDGRPQIGDRFAAQLVWMGDEPLQLSRSYLLKLATRSMPASIGAVTYRLDVETLAQDQATTLRLNEIGLADVATLSPLAYDRYADDAILGAFILIDRASHATVAAGMIETGLRKATNVHLQEGAVGRADRAAGKHQRPAVLWFTGLSGAGKSTIANRVEAELHAAGAHTMLLDGDNLRHGLNKDLGFSQADRLENIRRVAEVARLMADAGLIVLCSFISPFREERRMARETVGADDFLEVFVDTPLSTCIARDPKGLYKRALAGEIKDFTGIGQAYEAPEQPDLVVGRAVESIETAAAGVIALLSQRGFLEGFGDLKNRPP